MKNLGLSFLAVISISSIAFAESYERDSFSIRTEQGKMSLRISGHSKGVLGEIVAYLKTAGIKPIDDNGWIEFKGPQKLTLNTQILSLDVDLNPGDLIEAGGGMTVSSTLGTIETVRIGGTTAQYLVNAMEKAGISKHVYPGNPKSYEFEGRLIGCSYTDGIWGYSCDLRMPEDLTQYK